MKKIFLFVIFAFIFSSCVTNYYSSILVEDTSLFNRQGSTREIAIVPKGEKVFLSTKFYRGKYKRIKWKNYSGWAINPKDSIYKPTTKTTFSSYTPSVNSKGSVHVRGYYRKNGTYVRPHTRSSKGSRRR